MPSMRGLLRGPARVLSEAPEMVHIRAPGKRVWGNAHRCSRGSREGMCMEARLTRCPFVVPSARMSSSGAASDLDVHNTLRSLLLLMPSSESPSAHDLPESLHVASGRQQASKLPKPCRAFKQVI